MKLSIITINYNDAVGLEKTLQSVANQTKQPFEYIVIDGGSTDDSVNVLKRYSHIVTQWISEKDQGIYNAMNKGVSLATGDYCQFLNAGDCLHDQDVLATIFAKHQGSDIIFSHLLLLPQTLFTVHHISLMTFYHSSVPHGSAFIRRKLLETTPYDEQLRIVSDWKFFMQTLILQNVSYELVDVVSVDFDTTGISSTNKELDCQERKAVLQQEIPARILTDYERFSHIGKYEATPYDDFFLKLRPTRYGQWIYRLSILLMRLVSLFKKDFSFVKEFPLKVDTFK